MTRRQAWTVLGLSLVVLTAFAGAAYAGIIEVIIMMCPVRHPFALLGWHGAHTDAAALVQWGIISSGVVTVGTVFTLWGARRR